MDANTQIETSRGTIRLSELIVDCFSDWIAIQQRMIEDGRLEDFGDFWLSDYMDLLTPADIELMVWLAEN